MKNVTLSLDDQTWHAARIAAAERGLSLSALVREYLASLPSSRSHGERVRKLLRTLRSIRSKNPVSGRLGRDEMYGRSRVR